MLRIFITIFFEFFFIFASINGNMMDCFNCNPTTENCLNINSKSPTIECGEFADFEAVNETFHSVLKNKQLNVFEIRTDDKSYFTYQCYSVHIKKDQTNFLDGEYKGCYKLRAPFNDVCDAIKSDLGKDGNNIHCKSCNTDRCNSKSAKPVPPLPCYKCSPSSPGDCNDLSQANLTTCNKNANNYGPISQCYSFKVYQGANDIEVGTYRGCYPVGKHDQNVCETIKNKFGDDGRFIECLHCNHKKCNRQNLIQGNGKRKSLSVLVTEKSSGVLACLSLSLPILLSFQWSWLRF